MNSPCRCCQELVPDASKRLEPCLGFVCVPCFEFLTYTDKALRKVGVEGVAHAPARISPEAEAL